MPPESSQEGLKNESSLWNPVRAARHGRNAEAFLNDELLIIKIRGELAREAREKGMPDCLFTTVGCA